MKIKLYYNKLTGKSLNAEKFQNDSQIDVPDKCIVRDLISFLEIPKNRKEAISVYINNEPAWNSTILKEGDSVKLLTIIGGG
jgi:sulfur carrier protein ThiS